MKLEEALRIAKELAAKRRRKKERLAIKKLISEIENLNFSIQILLGIVDFYKEHPYLLVQEYEEKKRSPDILKDIEKRIGDYFRN